MHNRWLDPIILLSIGISIFISVSVKLINIPLDNFLNNPYLLLGLDVIGSYFSHIILRKDRGTIHFLQWYLLVLLIILGYLVSKRSKLGEYAKSYSKNKNELYPDLVTLDKNWKLAGNIGPRLLVFFSYVLVMVTTTSYFNLSRVQSFYIEVMFYIVLPIFYVLMLFINNKQWFVAILILLFYISILILLVLS